MKMDNYHDASDAGSAIETLKLSIGLVDLGAKPVMYSQHSEGLRVVTFSSGKRVEDREVSVPRSCCLDE